MSEQRFDCLENQLNQVIQAIGTMQQNIDTRLNAVEQKVSDTLQKLSAVEQNVNAAREDIISLCQKTDSIELSKYCFAH